MILVGLYYIQLNYPIRAEYKIMSGLSSQEVTNLLLAWRKGEQEALDKLTPVVYEEL